MQAAFDIAPRNRAFERYLVSMLRESGQNAEAEDVLRQHLEVYPDDDAAKVELARTMRAEGRTEEAIAAMQEVVAQSPENLNAQLEPRGESQDRGAGGRGDGGFPARCRGASRFRSCAACSRRYRAFLRQLCGVSETASRGGAARLRERVLSVRAGAGVREPGQDSRIACRV